FRRFVGEEATEGRAGSIRESLIGVEVFRRAAMYDPKTDSTVRIQAARLREKLRDYYSNTGRKDDLVIELPKGSYVPVWRQARGQRRPTVRWRFAMAGLALGIVVAGAALAWRMSTPRPLTSIAV